MDEHRVTAAHCFFFFFFFFFFFSSSFSSSFLLLFLLLLSPHSPWIFLSIRIPSPSGLDPKYFGPGPGHAFFSSLISPTSLPTLCGYFFVGMCYDSLDLFGIFVCTLSAECGAPRK